MQLSLNFTKEEFACQCGCGFNDISIELVRVLQDLRDQVGGPITINSGCRCPKHNAEVGGVGESTHMKGLAADIVVKGLSTQYVYKLLDELYSDKYGLGVYPTWVHIDVRPTKARWSHI